MKLSIGEKIICKNEDCDGVFYIGEIVDIWRNREEMITGYSTAFNSGNYVNINHEYLKVAINN